MQHLAGKPLNLTMMAHWKMTLDIVRFAATP